MVVKNIYSLFGKRFKELREAKKLTQEQLAEYLGVEARQISRIETGKCFTTLDNLCKIAKIYNVEVKDIFSFEYLNNKQDFIDATVAILNSASEDYCKKIDKITKEFIF